MTIIVLVGSAALILTARVAYIVGFKAGKDDEKNKHYRGVSYD